MRCSDNCFTKADSRPANKTDCGRDRALLDCLPGCPSSKPLRWFLEKAKKTDEKYCGPSPTGDKTRFNNAFIKLSERAYDASDRVPCFKPASDVDGFCKLYGDCIWGQDYWKVLDEASADDLPPDFADDVKYYTEINFKFVYAIKQGIHFGDQDIPEECNYWYEE